MDRIVPMPRKPDVTLLHSAIDAVGNADDLDGALASLAAVLRDPYQLWSLWLCDFRSPEGLQILARWTTRDTAFVPGMQISTSFTEMTSQAAHTLFAGHPLVLHTGGIDFGIIEHLFRVEGIAAVACVPLRDGDSVSAMLVLATSVPEALDETDVPMLTALGRGLEIMLMPLVPFDPQEPGAR
jgi:GAF domain-containing protein